MSVLVNATPLGVVALWATRSQERARRNAMSACTVLAARRLEHDEVHAYVAAHLAVRTAGGTDVAVAVGSAR